MGIDQTYKNIQRLRQIATVFGAHGFSQVLEQIGLSKLVSWDKKSVADEKLSVAIRLRMALDELGPTFIKLGQTLSLRADILPPDFIVELKKLQDDASPFSVEEVVEQIEKELGAKLSDVCDKFEDIPVGAASLAQVHRAKLKTGEDVVFKVRRPGIKKLIDTDLSILYTLARMMERYIPVAAVVNPLEVVDEFSRTLRQELDFANEAGNIERFSQNFESEEKVHFPKVFWEFTGRRILTMSYVDGIKLSDLNALDEASLDKKTIALLGARAFMKMVFIDGFFHGDIHGGNVFAVDGDSIGIIDCGVSGHMDPRLVAEVASLFTSLIARDFESVARIYIDLGGSSARVDERAFASDLRRVIEPLMGRSLKDIQTGPLFVELAQLALKHRVKVPRDVLLLARSITSMEGLGRQLDPEFDAMAVASEFAKIVIAERYRPEQIVTELLKLGHDISTLGKNAPKQLQGFMRRLERDELATDIRVRDRRTWKLFERLGTRVALAVMFSGGLISIAVDSSSEIGFAGVFGYFVTFASLLGLGVSFIRDGDRL